MSAEDLTRANRILQAQVSVAEILAYLSTDCYMTKTTAAKYIDHNDKKIEELIRSGQLRAYRIGKKTLVKKSDLERVIAQHEVTREKKQSDKSDLSELVTRAVEAARHRKGGG
jgi:excisionase family DNA binding protein